MEKLKIGETRDIVDDNGNILMSCGAVDAPKMIYCEVNSWVEGFYSDIISIEDEIRKYCISNNIEIIHLYRKKSSWLRETCYYNLKGKDYYKMNKISEWIKNLEG